jgi:hypothetical protein
MAGWHRPASVRQFNKVWLPAHKPRQKHGGDLVFSGLNARETIERTPSAIQATQFIGGRVA